MLALNTSPLIISPSKLHSMNLVNILLFERKDLIKTNFIDKSQVPRHQGYKQVHSPSIREKYFLKYYSQKILNRYAGKEL